MIKKDNKIYAEKNYSIKEKVCSSKWSEEEGEKNFRVPRLLISILNKDALSMDDIFLKVSLSGLADSIQSSKTPNTEAIVDHDKKQVTFVAITEIKAGEEITYTLSTQNIRNVKVQ